MKVTHRLVVKDETISTVLGGIVEHSECPGMRQWSDVQAIETRALVTAWPRLRTALKDKLPSKAGPMILET